MNLKKTVIGVVLGILVAILALVLPQQLGLFVGFIATMAGGGGFVLCLLFDSRSPVKKLPREGELDWEIFTSVLAGGVLSLVKITLGSKILSVESWQQLAVIFTGSWSIVLHYQITFSKWDVIDYEFIQRWKAIAAIQAVVSIVLLFINLALLRWDWFWLPIGLLSLPSVSLLLAAARGRQHTIQDIHSDDQ